MSQIKYHIFVFLACFCSLAFAQEESVEDADMLSLRLQNRIEQAKLESDRGDYYNALDNLNKAFEIAEKIEDKASQGKIHTKIAKVQFLVNEQDQANISLNKASQIQREISENERKMRDCEGCFEEIKLKGDFESKIQKVEGISKFFRTKLFKKVLIKNVHL